MSRARIAFGLLAGLAVCCSVMYFTSDASDEFIHESFVTETVMSNGKDLDAGTSVGNTDVLKAGQIYTDTPDGIMRLMDYFTNVEKEIADEVSKRKSDIAMVRAKMARDFAFNSAARSKLKRSMMHKMAVNAKIARDDMAAAMRKTQRHFAKQAHLANQRYKATLRRDHRTRKLVRKNAREAKRNLKLAVSQWQKNQHAFAAATNAKINRMNKEVSANAAQIKTNAKKARKDLEKVTQQWDHKIHSFSAHEKAANSKLSQQFAAQSKATRAWASNKIKSFVAATASQFDQVNAKMAKNRQEVDMALRHATMKFEATLNGMKALESKRFAKTVANIAAAKKEAQAKLDAATSGFKVALLSLSATVKEQVSKVNNNIDKTAGVVRSNAAAQAKVNANINAEMGRMVKLGNKRYKQQLRADAELHNLINKQQADTDRKMKEMANKFNNQLNTIKKQLAKDRKHAEHSLKKGTSAVFNALKKQQDMQADKNAQMAADIRRMKMDAMDNLRTAKRQFAKKLDSLGATIADNDKKADAKIKKLTGVVNANAAKSAKGRQQLRQMEEANKSELRSSIAKAVEDGEKRAQALEKNAKKLDKDTQWLINNKLDGEINKLKKEVSKGVEDLALQDAEARKEQRKEMLYAIRSYAQVAKNDLDLVVKKNEADMEAFSKKAAKSHAKGAAARKALELKIAANAKAASQAIKDAVASDTRAQLALAKAQAKAIKKTNTDVEAYGKQMKAISLTVRAQLKKMEITMAGKIGDEEKRAKAAVAKFKSADQARKLKVLGFFSKTLKQATADADSKFVKLSLDRAKTRTAMDSALGTAVSKFNDALAKQAALADSRFSKTVNDLGKARKAVLGEVTNLRKDMAVSIVSATAQLKNLNTEITDLIEKVSGEVGDAHAAQLRINRKTAAEMKRTENLVNSHISASKRARGQLRRIMDENKAAAAAETKALWQKTDVKLKKLRAHSAHAARTMKQGLTKASMDYYTDLRQQQAAQQAGVSAMNAATKAEVAAAAAKLKHSQAMFKSKIVETENLITATQESQQRAMARITGVAADVNKANKADRALIRKQIAVSEADAHKALAHAISMGEAQGKALAQRLAEHQKGVKRYLSVELVERVEAAADTVLKTIEGDRQKIADNYLSLKAYAIAAADAVQDEIGKGKGKALSSVGDFLGTLGALGPVKPKKAAGVGMGGDSVPSIFGSGSYKVSKSLATINGLVNEYSKTAQQVRNRWPLGLGRYLLDRLQVSMEGKGVLQVDKVPGKPGNFVYINARSVGLSNKLTDFAHIAATMATYEAALSKLTAKITVPKGPKKTPFKKPGPPEWDGN